jgi:hypothetical protein
MDSTPVSEHVDGGTPPRGTDRVAGGDCGIRVQFVHRAVVELGLVLADLQYAVVLRVRVMNEY